MTILSRQKPLLPALALALLVALAAPAAVAPARGADAPAEDPNGMLGTSSGAEIYAQICQGCHMPDGRGAQGAGRYPAFAGNPNIASSRYMAVTILNGRRNMPSFTRPTGHEFYFETVWLTDTQVANVINHIRTSFGNDYHDAISAEEVRALHPESKKD